MGAITDFTNKKSFRNVEWNPDKLRATDRQILCALKVGRQTIADIIAVTGYEADYVTWRMRQMSGAVPPLVNQIGATGIFQLSVEGRKVMRVVDVHVVAPAPSSIIHVEPGPRGQLVKILKEKPTSITEMMRETRLNYQQVYYTLKTLKERGLMGERVRQGRELLHRLKSTPDPEPPKPLLTPSVVPLCDEADWHTWLERLLLHKLGGPEVVLEGVSDEQFIPQSQQQRKRLPKVLLIGWFKGDLAQRIENEFTDRLDLRFVDTASSKSIEALVRRMDHVFIRADHCVHDLQESVKRARKSVNYLKGNAERICQTLERHFQ